jgi:hypothetical protein
MLKERLAAARRIANHLTNAEEAIDDAIINLSTLMAALPAERRAVNMRASLGHDAMAKTAQAIALSGQLRTAIIDAHKALFTVQAEVGLSAYAIGPTSDTPNGMLEPETEHLRPALRVA